MLKQGSWRALRNLPTGWLTHALHGREKTERAFHAALELVSWLALFSLWQMCFPDISSTAKNALVTLLLVHTLMWIIDGNFHVYMLDSFSWVRNAGIRAVLDFIVWATNLLIKTGTVECVLIYGSFCRGTFHKRSDLDLRVVRRKRGKESLIVFAVAIYVRMISLVRGIPMDLQVVDSMAFLNRQMRLDEKPVIAYCHVRFNVENRGLSLEDVIKDPSLALKHNK